jgi:hypothetical protein
MTAQIPDLFLCKGFEYSLAGISEGALFGPSMFGLEPVANCSACWRGYQAVFALADSCLVLATQHVELCEKEGHFVRKEGPPINRVLPIGPMQARDLFNNHYVGINHPLDYTGGLLLARGFFRELYVHMGFHPAWKYDEVVELIFGKGMLQDEYDRSKRIARIRERILKAAERGDGKDRRTIEEIWDFVESSFDRKYRR